MFFLTPELFIFCFQGKEKHQLEQETSELRVQIETIKAQKEHYQRELHNKDDKIQQLVKDLQIMVSDFSLICFTNCNF